MHKTISIWDLISCPEIKTSIQNGDEETFLKQMYFLGFDTSLKVDEVDCYHLSMVNGNTPVFGKLYRGTERTDSAWVGSRACTLENKIELVAEKDPEFAEELGVMGSFPNLADLNARHLKGEAEVFPSEMIKNLKENDD